MMTNKNQLIPFFIIVLALLAKPINAQEISIKGQVTDQIDNSGLPMVTVVELDVNNRNVGGVISDIDGNYFIKLSNSSHKIQFSFIGYETYTVDVNGRKEINVALAPQSHQLMEIEIAAEKSTDIGMNINHREISVPIAKVDMKDVAAAQASSIDEMLQGRLAGVDIVSNSGAPGSGMSIRVRGVSTLNASDQPLIVIDNIPQDQSVPSTFDFATANDEGYAEMLNVSVEDIESITVLKDAASTALWGPQGSNGVLMIATKRGVLNRKPVVSVSYKGSVAFKPEMIPMLNGDQYSTLISEATMNATGVPLNTDVYQEFSYDPTNPFYFYNYSNNTSWTDEITQRGFTNNYDISLSGGGSKASYRLSANYMDQKGTTVGTDLQTLRTRLNMDYKISDKLMLRANFSYSRGENDKSYRKYLQNDAYSMMPNMAIYEYDTDGQMTPNYFSPLQNIQGRYSSMYNSVAMANNAMNTIINNDIKTNVSLNYTILKNLRFSSDIAFRLSNTKGNTFLPQNATGLLWTDNAVNVAGGSDNDNYNIYTKNKLTYSIEFNENHKLNALLQYTTSDSRGFEFYTQSNGSASDLLNDPSIEARNKEVGKLNSDTWQNREASLSGMLHYSLLDRYIMTLVGTQNGNSKFYEKYRFGFYPSVSLSWRISSEPFMRSLEFLEDFRLRYSYGENGKAPKYPYLFYSNYSTYSWDYMGQSGVYPTNIQLENMKWENFITNNYGVTVTMLDRLIDMQFDYYRNRTEDLIDYSAELPSSSGYASKLSNIGVMEAIGWDFNINSQVHKTRDAQLNLFFNISRNYNVLREIDESYNLERDRTTSNGQYKMIIQVDNPIGSFYGYEYEGVYTSENQLIARDANGEQIFDATGNAVKMVYNYPNVNHEFQLGDAKYKDINHDGNINYQDVVYLGDANPDFVGGFGASYKYKGFGCSLTFYGRYGNSIINATQMSGENMYGYDNQLASTLKRWRNPGDVTDMPRALTGTGYNWLGSNRYVHDGSFLRLKYVSFYYDLPKAWLTPINLRQAKLSLTLNNLFTFTNYIGQDPEISIKSQDGSVFSVGVDYSTTPVPKQATVSLSIQF